MHLRRYFVLLALAALTAGQVNKTYLTQDILVSARSAFDGCLPASPNYTLVKWTEAQTLSPGPPNSSVFAEELSLPLSGHYCKNNFTIYNITYTDDPTTSYTTGICTLSSRTPDSLFKLIGRLPFVVRPGIKSFVLAPEFALQPGFSSMGNDLDSFWFSGNFAPIDAVWAFATSFAGDVLDYGQWVAAVGNDSCVVDEESARKIYVEGDYFDSAVGAVVMAVYQVLVGPWPRDIGCMRNQLAIIGNQTRWVGFGDEFSSVGLCHFTLPPGSLPSGRR